MLTVTNHASQQDISGLAKGYGNWWSAARQISRWQLLTAEGIERAWAYGTLAELELLGAIFGHKEHDADSIKKEIARCCREILEVCVPGDFQVQSTMRQFRRYVDIWPRPEWIDLARTALAVLGNKKPGAIGLKDSLDETGKDKDME